MGIVEKTVEESVRSIGVSFYPHVTGRSGFAGSHLSTGKLKLF